MTWTVDFKPTRSSPWVRTTIVERFTKSAWMAWSTSLEARDYYAAQVRPTSEEP